QTFTLTINQAPAITSANDATVAVGTPMSFTVVAIGFPTPAITTSALPTGLTFNPATNILAGTPASGDDASSPYIINFVAVNGVSPDTTQNFTLTVEPAFAIISTSPVDGATSVPRNSTISVTFNRATNG